MERHTIKKATGAKTVPKISVVIPAYNEELVIAHTLRAVLAQDYPDFEVIVVNNASTDRTAEVVEKIAAMNGSNGLANLRLVHESKKGLLHARERGRVEAHGDIVANMDADCLPETDWLRIASEYFTFTGDGFDGEVVAVSGPYDYHDAHPFFRASSMAMQSYIYRPVANVLQWPFVRGGAVLIGGNNAIRADILRKMGGYNTALVFYGEDTDTAKRVAKHGRVVFTPRVKMKTSARRFKEEGTLRMTARYLFHFFKHTFRGV